MEPQPARVTPLTAIARDRQANDTLDTYDYATENGRRRSAVPG